MSKLFTTAELSGLTIHQLQALYRTIYQELIQSPQGSDTRRNALASLENINRAIANHRSLPAPRF